MLCSPAATMSFMPEGAMDKINEACQEFTTSFSAYMLLGFFEVAINMAKEKADSKPEDDPEQLLSMPVPDWTIKSGWLTKEGGNFHSWKKRFFVARNQSDKFVIEYYSSDKCLEKEKKGSINCAGYRAKKDTAKKPNGITLTPWDDERRAWHIACESPAEQDEWMSVFENATWNAKPAGDPDEMIQNAFEVAFNKLKTSRGFWYSFRFDRGPEEMLAKLLIMDLDRTVISEILSQVSTPGNMGITSARSAVRAIIVKTCAAACAAAWAGSKPALDLAKSVVEEKVPPPHLKPPPPRQFHRLRSARERTAGALTLTPRGLLGLFGRSCRASSPSSTRRSSSVTRLSASSPGSPRR